MKWLAAAMLAVALSVAVPLLGQTEPAYAAQGSLAAGSASVSGKSSGNVVPVYRMYNAWTGEHHYTTDKHERNVLPSYGWRYEGVAWMTPSSGKAIYRLYQPTIGLHHYTADTHERDVLVSSYGWRDEGVLSYSASSKETPVYRLYHPYSAQHHYTTDAHERDVLVRSYGWRYEGVAWYGAAVPSDFKDDMKPWTAHISGDVALDGELDKILFNHKSLWSCYKYVSGLSYREGNRFYSNPRYLPDSTTIPFAREMATRGSGNCYRYASLFCWLARGLGYDAKVVSGWVPSYSGGKAPHGWVEIKQDGKTYICDPDMYNAIPSRNWYMVPYSNAPTTYGFW